MPHRLLLYFIAGSKVRPAAVYVFHKGVVTSAHKDSQSGSHDLLWTANRVQEPLNPRKFPHTQAAYP